MKPSVTPAVAYRIGFTNQDTNCIANWRNNWSTQVQEKTLQLLLSLFAAFTRMTLKQTFYVASSKCLAQISNLHTKESLA